MYKAHDLNLNRYVAVKVLRREKANEINTRRFLREAELHGNLSNIPEILTVYVFSRTRGGTLFIVMELLKGQTSARYTRCSSGTLRPFYSVATWPSSLIIICVHARSSCLTLVVRSPSQRAAGRANCKESTFHGSRMHPTDVSGAARTARRSSTQSQHRPSRLGQLGARPGSCTVDLF